VFSPYSETYGSIDMAKMRSTPAYFEDAAGISYLFVSGSTKVAEDQPGVVPPSLIRLKIVTRPPLIGFLPPGGRSLRARIENIQPAHLAVDLTDRELRFLNPGSPVLSSNGTRGGVVWVLDANLLRSKPLLGSDVPHPVLYAIDAQDLHLLWRSSPDQLNVGGKYGTVAIAHGVVFVATDRIQAFGLR
jgi:hypothetical protein